MITAEDIANKSNDELKALLLQQARALEDKKLALQNQQAEIKCLHVRINQLLQSQYGQKSEKYDHSQQYTLFDEATVESEEKGEIAASEAEITIATHTRCVLNMICQKMIKNANAAAN